MIFINISLFLSDDLIILLDISCHVFIMLNLFRAIYLCFVTAPLNREPWIEDAI